MTTPFDVGVAKVVVAVVVVAITDASIVIVDFAVRVVVVPLKFDFQQSVLHRSFAQHLLHEELLGILIAFRFLPTIGNPPDTASQT